MGNKMDILFRRLLTKNTHIHKEKNMKHTNNKYVLDWINEMAEMTQPDKIVWIDGSEEQAETLRAEACSTGEMI